MQVFWQNHHNISSNFWYSSQGWRFENEIGIHRIVSSICSEKMTTSNAIFKKPLHYYCTTTIFACKVPEKISHDSETSSSDKACQKVFRHIWSLLGHKAESLLHVDIKISASNSELKKPLHYYIRKQKTILTENSHCFQKWWKVKLTVVLRQ